MNKLLIIFLLVGVIFIAGCVGGPKDTKGKVVEPEINESLENKSLENETLTNESEVVDKIEVEGCKGENWEEVDNCLYSGGKCSSIHSVDLKDKCYYEQHNCEKILNKDLREKCNYEEKMRDCDNDEWPALCRAKVSGDAKFCGEDLDCTLQFAYLEGDLSKCEGLEGYNSTVCRAIVNGNYYLCYSEIDIEVFQKNCIVKYSEVTGRDGNICEGLSSDYYKDDCKYWVAQYSENPKKCKEITALQTWRKCILDLSQKMGDVSVCDYAYDEDARDYCIRVLAKKTHTPKYCEEVEDPGDRWRCFGDAIVKDYISKEKCDEISDRFEEWKEECYSELEKE